MDLGLFQRLVDQYRKYGWGPRRILVGASGDELLPLADRDLVTVKTNAGIDAVWFSRPRKDGRVAWELRHLSETPYALVEVFDSSLDAAELDDALAGIEEKMRQVLTRKN